MSNVSKLTAVLLLAAFALVAMAAPVVPDGTATATILGRVLVPNKATATRDAIPPVCTEGLPASLQRPAGYPINNFTVVTPADAANWTSYSVKTDWYRSHYISGPHTISATRSSDPYGPFKCQYTCNAANNCNGYFAWYDNVGTSEEHFNCVLFDAVIPASALVPTTGTIAAGAYDRLCERS